MRSDEFIDQFADNLLLTHIAEIAWPAYQPRPQKILFHGSDQPNRGFEGFGDAEKLAVGCDREPRRQRVGGNLGNLFIEKLAEIAPSRAFRDHQTKGLNGLRVAK